MACERWCFNRGLDTARQPRWPFALLLLTLCILGSALSAQDRDSSYYSYGALRSGKSSLDFKSLEINFVPDDEADLARRRRDANEKSFTTAEPESAESSKQQEPQKDQPKEPPFEGKKQAQLPSLTKQQESSILIPTSSVPYLTDYRTTNASSNTTEPTEIAKSDMAKQKKVIKPPDVSKPEHPPSEKSEISVWANRTRFSNFTEKSAEKNETKITTSVEDDMNNKDKDKTDSEVSDVSINSQLMSHNITKTIEDNHQYYNSTFIVDENIGKKFYVDMNNYPNLKVDHLLSKSYRRAATIELKFDFPFYGHKVRNITVATGGFLYTGDYVHSWLAATQYIAPLMANFDTGISNDSKVKYADNGTSFTVEWEKVHLQDKPNAGAFTFQVTLHQNGDIVFVYPVIPLVVEEIEDTAHPVKVGLSDAYIMDRTVFFVRKKTIYEYHRVLFNRTDIKNWTAIYLKALPTCLQMTNCSDCLTKVPKFDCKWCNEINLCSTGTSRSRQDWLLKQCDVKHIKELNKCPAATTTYKEHDDGYDHKGVLEMEDVVHPSGSSESIKAKKPDSSSLEHARDNMNMGVSGVIGILIVVVLISGLAGWAAYAYRNPHTASGQMLIRYRPSQWSWRRGEARYTAATIHM